MAKISALTLLLDLKCVFFVWQQSDNTCFLCLFVLETSAFFCGSFGSVHFLWPQTTESCLLKRALPEVPESGFRPRGGASGFGSVFGCDPEKGSCGAGFFPDGRGVKNPEFLNGLP